MRVQFRLNAGPHERYTDQFAQSLIGKRPRLNFRQTEDGPVIADYGRATVVDAEVIEDGAAVLITYETPDTFANQVAAGNVAGPNDASMSFRFIEAEPAEPETLNFGTPAAEARPPGQPT